jgi:hypothetical protein
MWQEVQSGQKIIELHHYHGLREGLSAHADEIVARIMADPTLSERKPALECAIETLFCALTAVDANGRHIRRQQTFGQLVDLTRFRPGFAMRCLTISREGCRSLMPQGSKILGWMPSSISATRL